MKAVSLFAGCGGFCEGAELAGFEITVAVEWDKYACMTYRENFPKTPLFEGDIHDFLKPGSDHETKYKLKDLDLVFGGPPCQGFSQIGPRDLLDDRNVLYREFARVIRKIKPRMFLMENVPNLLLMQKGHFRDAIMAHFSELGYSNTTYLKVSAADFGVPQTRERVFFFGTRDDIKFPFELQAFAEAFLKGLKVKQPVTVWQAIGDLPANVVHSGETAAYPTLPKGATQFLKAMRLDTAGGPYTKAAKRRRGVGKKDELILHNHHTKEMQAKRAKLISYLKPGAKADSLPKHIWNGARPEKWRRLHPDLPSYTILAQMHRDLSEWVHPKLERWISVREAARLQSFHDGFVFKGSEWQQLKQVGNAVPPLLGFVAAKLAVAALRAKHEDVKLASPVQHRLPTAMPSNNRRRAGAQITAWA
ncbi:DNA-cytosine methyltransferase [Sphingobium chlorophenolicum L-1]|uniref:Cytosine-specific methyltransferase n=1 Tax=Sphingobium chlorophenolicum L-1 TaxID=690566 RepID=F6EYC1_SPHCR|nr:DNA cytosine methyltransferase [Sphingobium chlorophenolicum]AEG50074.1 DNA-cytosine methyltransferase [Sphingobium chlorophenolicum L-1]